MSHFLTASSHSAANVELHQEGGAVKIDEHPCHQGCNLVKASIVKLKVDARYNLIFN
jgi:hypothetical protein